MLEDKYRFEIENAVLRALEAGATESEILNEVEYQIENFEEEE